MNLHPCTRIVSAAACLVIAVGCSSEGIPPTEHEAVLEQVRKQKMAINELEKKVDRAADAAERDSPELKKYKQLVDELREQSTGRKDALESLQKEFEKYKATYRASVRSKDLDYKIALIETEEGDYKDVVVTSADPAGIRIAYDGGSGRLRFDQLNDELRTRFGYKPGEATTFLAAEETQREENTKRFAAAAKVRERTARNTLQKPTSGQISTAKAEISKLVAIVRNSRERADKLAASADKADYAGRGGASTISKRRESVRLRNLADQAERRIGEIQSNYPALE